MKDLERRVAALEQRRRGVAAVAAIAVADNITPAEAAEAYARFMAGPSDEDAALLAGARVGPPRPKDWTRLYRDLVDGKPVDDRF